jgi:outer membrane protein assembly factor BamB
VHATTLDAAGDVIAAGGFARSSRQFSWHTDFVVAKLDGASGSELWRRTFPGTFRGTEDHEAFNQAWAVATNAQRDVIASGVLVKRSARPRPFRRWTILKLAGSDGATRWKRDLGETFPRGSDEVNRSLAVDVRGDVLAVAETTRRRSPNVALLNVVKLSGRTGDVRWRRMLGRRALGPAMLATMPGGDVAVAAGVLRRDEIPAIVVAVLDGATGRARWRRVVEGSAAEPLSNSVLFSFNSDTPAALVADAAGDVFLAGLLRNTSVGADFAVVALDAKTGAERWRRVIDGDAHADEGARALALAGGDVLAAGEVKGAGGNVDALAVALTPSSGDERWRLRCAAADCR